MNKTNYDTKKILDAYRIAAPVLHLPRGNVKTGSIPAFNLAPGITCSKCARKTCYQDGCYALRDMCKNGYNPAKNSVLRAWTENTKKAVKDIDGFIREMDAYLTIYGANINGGRFFRIHAAGDFFNSKYAQAWYTLAERHPEIKFLAFTKSWDAVRAVDFSALPNFSLVLSGWEGVEIPADLRAKYPAAFCIGTEGEKPAGAILCPGHCEACGACWSLARNKQDVSFLKH